MKWLTQGQSSFPYRSFVYDTVVILLLSVFLIGPLLTPHWIKVGESVDQILRVIELDRGIREGYLYPRWFGDLAGGFGYPYFVFYSPLIYYVSEFFCLLGFDIVTSLKCMIIFGVVLAGIGMFWFAKSFWGTRGAMVSAVAYIYVPYRIVNLYIRGDFAEAFAMSLLPFILHFFFLLITQQGVLYLLASSLCYAMLVLTHNCTALIFSAFLVLFVAFISANNGDWSGLSRGLLALIWGCGLSAVFWLPALWEKKWVNIELLYSYAFDFHRNFLEPFRLLWPLWTFDVGPGGRDLPLQIGAPHVLLSILSLVFIMKLDVSKYRRTRQLSLFFLVSCIFLFYLMISSSLVVWENLPLLKYIQFPWRLLSLLSFFTSFLCGGLFVYFRFASKASRDILQIVLVVIIVLTGAQHCYVKGYLVIGTILTPSFVRKVGSTISSYNTEKMDKIRDYGEYLPKTVIRLPDKMNAGRIFVTDGEAKILNPKTWLQRYEFDVIVEKNAVITVGSFYYPSWMARLDGKRVHLFTGEQGLIHLEVPGGRHHIEVFFGDTTVRRIGKYISLLSFFAVLACLLGSRMKTWRRALPELADRS